MTSFKGTALPTLAQNCVMGAVELSTGVFYDATIDNIELVIFGFNTNTNTAIPGVVATVNIAGRPLANGDFAFDQLGNLYILEGDSTGKNPNAIVRVNGPLPMTGTATLQAPLPYSILANHRRPAPAATSTTASPSALAASSTPSTRPAPASPACSRSTRTRVPPSPP